jgi:hypothetical protein
MTSMIVDVSGVDKDDNKNDVVEDKPEEEIKEESKIIY